VARGAQLAAIQSRGLSVQIGGEEFCVQVDASENASDFGVQDIVFVTVKAPALETAVKAMVPLLGARTTVVFLMNGIPWWYYFEHGGPEDGRDIARLNPNGTIRSIVGPERAIGGIAYCSATVVEPGRIIIDYPDAKFEFGEPDGTNSLRVTEVVNLLKNAKLDAIAVGNIRERIWAKLLLNMTTGPLAVIAGVRLKELCARPPRVRERRAGNPIDEGTRSAQLCPGA
jgi:2-dehydropantoate 2-reductase